MLSENLNACTNIQVIIFQEEEGAFICYIYSFNHREITFFCIEKLVRIWGLSVWSAMIQHTWIRQGWGHLLKGPASGILATTGAWRQPTIWAVTHSLYCWATTAQWVWADLVVSTNHKVVDDTNLEQHARVVLVFFFLLLLPFLFPLWIFPRAQHHRCFF